ncbi:MAG: rod shape-determining protein MreD [Lactobacillales bacterium]|jgi:rod shape-determining protein MreD|nr:rod shape-determining protein MreD [Lactobacillales bacterium]
MKQVILKCYTPIILFFGMLLDGQLSTIMESITKNHYFTLSNLTLLLFLIGAKNLSKSYIIFLALIIGCFYDSYFTGIFGINMFLYPLFTYWFIRFKKTINKNILTQLASFIIAFTSYQILLMLMQIIFNLAKVNFILFIVSTLGPSILFNILLFLIFIWPFRFLFCVKNSTLSS